MKYLLITIVLAVLGLLLLNAIRRVGSSGTAKSKLTIDLATIPHAQRIKFNELSGQLQDCVNGKTEFDFLGIHSNGTDCIYFMQENDQFNIDFEAMTKEQLPYIDRLKNYAGANQIKTKMMTYGNSPHYKSSDSAPVLRLETYTDLDGVVEIARGILIDVFNNTDDTVYEVVP